MTTNPVGATKSVFVTQTRVQEAIEQLKASGKEKVEGGIFDGYTMKQLEELSNKSFNEAMGLYIEQNFDERAGEANLKKDKLTSTNVTGYRYDSRMIYRNILETELPNFLKKKLMNSMMVESPRDSLIETAAFWIHLKIGIQVMEEVF